MDGVRRKASQKYSLLLRLRSPLVPSLSLALCNLPFLCKIILSNRPIFYRYNPALQPRGLVVFGCIAKSITDHEIKQLLRILFKALETFSDINLIEAIVMCLTRLQPLLRPESPIHKALFWVSIRYYTACHCYNLNRECQSIVL